MRNIASRLEPPVKGNKFLIDSNNIAILAQYLEKTSCSNSNARFEIMDDPLQLAVAVEDDDAIIRIDAGFAEKLAEKVTKQAKQLEIDSPKLFVPLELRHLIFTLLSNYLNNIVVLSHEEIGCNAKVEIIAEI